MNIYPVEYGAAYSAKVSFNLVFCAFARFGSRTEIAARTWIHSGNKHEICRIIGFSRSSRNRYHTVLHRLAQRFKYHFGKFCKLIEEQNSVMR